LARSAVGAFIEAVYNRQRLHSALHYRSPDEHGLWLPTAPVNQRKAVAGRNLVTDERKQAQRHAYYR
jgi:hypothetical protein